MDSYRISPPSFPIAWEGGGNGTYWLMLQKSVHNQMRSYVTVYTYIWYLNTYNVYIYIYIVWWGGCTMRLQHTIWHFFWFLDGNKTTVLFLGKVLHHLRLPNWPSEFLLQGAWANPPHPQNPISAWQQMRRNKMWPKKSHGPTVPTVRWWDFFRCYFCYI